MNDREEDMLVPVRPGDILADEFMQPLGLSANKLARKLGVPPNRISEIIKGRRSISADTALRLSQAFGTSPEFWMNLQSAYDLAIEQQRSMRQIRRTISRIGEAPSDDGEKAVNAQAAAQAAGMESRAKRRARPGQVEKSGTGGEATTRIDVDRPHQRRASPTAERPLSGPSLTRPYAGEQDG